MAAENPIQSAFVNRIKSRRAFDEFYNLLGQWLPPSLISWYHNNKNGFRSIFVGLSDEARDRLLALLRDDKVWSRNYFQCRVPDNLTVGWVFEALQWTEEYAAFRSFLDIGNRHPNNNTAGTQSRMQRSQALYDGYFPNVLTPNADVANTLYGNSSGYYRDSSNASNYVLNYGTSAQPYILPSHGSAILSHYNVHGHSHGHQRELIDMSNSLPNYAARIQPPDRVGTTIIPVDGGSTSGHSARAIGDDEIDGHLKFQGSLLPAVFTICYQSSMTLKSINNSPLPLSIKTYGYVIVSCAIVAAFASLGALSLCALKPNTLPFDCNPQNVIRAMHFVVAHFTGYAFIGLMCQTFLQDDPFIMWITAGLASAAFMALMIFIGNGKRR